MASLSISVLAQDHKEFTMMHRSKSLFVGLALSCLAGTPGAQSAEVLDAPSLERVTPMKHFTYDLARRKVVRHGSAPAESVSGTFCYINTDTSGFAIAPPVGEEYVDWGILGGTQGSQCLGLSRIVTCFTFAYATTSQDTSLGGPGAALTLAFYNNWIGDGLDEGISPVATFAFSGLPGYSGSSSGPGAAYSMTVELSGGEVFRLGDGAFGYSYRADGQTGPLLCYTGDGLGGFGAEPETGNADAFEVYIPDVTSGTYLGAFSFGGPPNNYSSWYGKIALLPGCSPTIANRNGGGTNFPDSLSCLYAVLGEDLTLSTFKHSATSAYAVAFDSPTSVTLGGGQVLLCFDSLGAGELFTGNGVQLTETFLVFGTSLPVPLDLSLCGFTFTTQALYFYPAGSPFRMSSACDVTLGG